MAFTIVRREAAIGAQKMSSYSYMAPLGADKAPRKRAYFIFRPSVCRSFPKRPSETDINADETVAWFKNEMKSFTVADLEEVEKRGRDLLSRVMQETTKTGYQRALERHHQAS
ncbi:hypothetical protein LZK98_09215 [Sphingomonas cannabina]|uniref:hypothetical protein n=1 Tax=Sphingomonas cannabina TaxID=2899123 RepID=UPI001F1E3B50|nr:hypothetical protein [Sphingomonas cannabina]UIJ47101.1 hypothetical protein LZK98_09215 [Sphingomonas cannabina]